MKSESRPAAIDCISLAQCILFPFYHFIFYWKTVNATETCLRTIGPWQTKAIKMRRIWIFGWGHIYCKLNLWKKAQTTLKALCTPWWTAWAQRYQGKKLAPFTLSKCFSYWISGKNNINKTSYLWHLVHMYKSAFSLPQRHTIIYFLKSHLEWRWFTDLCIFVLQFRPKV